MKSTARALEARGRARDARLKAARDRRLRLNPDRLAPEQRIDEAAVDVGVAGRPRAAVLEAVGEAERVAAAAALRLLAERLSLDEVVRLVGLERATV